MKYLEVVFSWIYSLLLVKITTQILDKIGNLSDWLDAAGKEAHWPNEHMYRPSAMLNNPY